MTGTREARSNAIQIGFVTALLLLGLVGFASSYGGLVWMPPGVGGIAIGVTVAAAAVYQRWGGGYTALMAVGAFFLLGGPIALRDETIAGVIPTIDTFRGLAQGATTGWKELITTVPPVGDTPPLLVIPYVTGLIAALAGTLVALRVRRPFPALVAPLAMLSIGILVGTSTPVSVVLQGAVFGVVAAAWWIYRDRLAQPLQQPRMDRSVALRRGVSALGLLVVAMVLAVPVGSALPLSEQLPRFTLREKAEPPLDPRAYASPLGSVRRYTVDLENDVLFTVTGLPAGERLRLATMDSYDGIVWGVGGGAGSGAFQRVGTQVTSDAVGRSADIGVTIEKYADVWVPDAGELTGIRFAGPRADELAKEFRYSIDADTGIVPQRLAAGDSYELSVVLPPVPSEEEKAMLAVQDDPGVGAAQLRALKELQGRLAAEGGADGPQAIYTQAAYIANRLQEDGYYTNGNTAQGRPPSISGHGAYRLSSFAADELLLGDEEQFAASAALLTVYTGIPTRVVLGAEVPEGMTGSWRVTGEDVTAWIEVGLGGRWLPLDVVPAKDKPIPEERPQRQQPNFAPQQVLPPPPPDAATAAAADSDSSDTAEDPDEGFDIPPLVMLVLKVVVLPLAVIAGCLGLLAAGKAMRRRRRRRMSTPAARITGGWHEVVGEAGDFGREVRPRATRLESAGAIGVASATGLATRADRATFGPDEPSHSDADAFWDAVDGFRSEIREGAPWATRLRAILSFESWRLR